LGLTTGNAPSNARQAYIVDEEDIPSFEPAPQPRAAEARPAPVAASVDDDDEDFEFFKKLAEDD